MGQWSEDIAEIQTKLQTIFTPFATTSFKLAKTIDPAIKEDDFTAIAAVLPRALATEQKTRSLPPALLKQLSTSNIAEEVNHTAAADSEVQTRENNTA